MTPPSGAPAALVIQNATVVTVDQHFSVLQADLHIADGRIAAMPPWGTPAPLGAEIIDARGCAIIPGFVQTHVHLCQALFRNLADDLALLDWLAQRIWPLEGAHDPDSLHASARLGLAELMRGGTTTILDMGTVHHHHAVMHAIEDSGIRAFSGKAMMDEPSTPATLAESTAASLEQSLALAERWHGAAGGRIQYAFAPRFALSCTETLLRELGPAAASLGSIIHTHASENADEVKLVEERTGRPNILYLQDLGLLGPHCAIAHCIWLNDDEIRALADTRTRVLHCPSSNLKLGSGICDVPGLIDAGVHLSLGADGAPCNNNLSALLEMRLAALLQKPRRGPTAMSARQALTLATRSGAEALGLEGQIGSIELGKKADLAVIDVSGLHAGPGASHIESQIVYACRDEDVVHVLVGGRFAVRHRQLTWDDPRRIYDDAKVQLQRAVIRSGLPIALI